MACRWIAAAALFAGIALLAVQPEALREGSSHPPITVSPQSGPLVGIVALPFLAPFAALLQLLFPGLLAVQWRQYRVAVLTMVSLATVIGLRLLVIWVYELLTYDRPWWLGIEIQYYVLAGVSVAGLMAAVVGRVLSDRTDAEAASHPPTKLEYWLFGVLVFVGVGWTAWAWFFEPTIFDAMTIYTAGSAMAFVHLFYRKAVPASAHSPRVITTQIAFLTLAAGTSVGLAIYFVPRPGPEPVIAGDVETDWQSYRGGQKRTGAADPDDPGPRRPQVLWSFDVAEDEPGVFAYVHSAPAVVDGQIYFGSMHTRETELYGKLHCLNVADGRALAGKRRKAGAFLWEFPGKDAKRKVKPIYSAPTVVKGRLYFGEGYHQDHACRLFCVDPTTGRTIWSFKTGSAPTGCHVESSPWVDGDLVCFGAGDDGVICLDASNLRDDGDGGKTPAVKWTIPRIHVDASPLIVDLPDKDDPTKSIGRRMFVGSVAGDLYKDLKLIGWDVEKERLLWQMPTSLPATTSPSYADGRLFFGFGRGQLGGDKQKLRPGAVWCVDAYSEKTPLRHWQFDTQSSVFAAPALRGEHVFVCEYDGICHCLRQDDGTVAWKRDLGHPVVSSPIVAGDKLYVATQTGRLFCLDIKDNGKDVWEPLDLTEAVSDFDKDIYGLLCSPMLYKGRIYVGIRSKMLCIGDPD